MFVYFIKINIRINKIISFLFSPNQKKNSKRIYSLFELSSLLKENIPVKLQGNAEYFLSLGIFFMMYRVLAVFGFGEN